MSAGIVIWRCKGCGTAVFPQRLLCPHCHGAAFDEDRVHQGVIEEVSVIRHMIGQTDWQPRRIANVRTPGGPSITVGLRDGSEPGTVVELEQEEGAPYARAKVRS
ncbi:MAG TPA: zinc ribbon domain-containing protein [Xanthobacteraceae bacterium]|nr:zinc ribbon domain-containing protein [Xanthobacteraceae bacterium]